MPRSETILASLIDTTSKPRSNAATSFWELALLILVLMALSAIHEQVGAMNDRCHGFRKES